MSNLNVLNSLILIINNFLIFLNNILICVISSKLDTNLYPNEKIYWDINALFTDSAEQIKSNCTYDMKAPVYIAYNCG